MNHPSKMLLANLILLAVSLICVVESAPTIAAAPAMGLSVEARDAILDRTNSCTPHLRLPDGSPMEEDLATYYTKRKCPMDTFFLMVFETKRGHDMLDELIVQRKKDASVCHGFIALLSLIDAYQLTEEMCTDRVLVSEKRAFCDHQRQDDSRAVVQVFAQLQYVRLEAVADFLSNLDDHKECSQVCGGFVDSALCNSFMDAAKFFSDRVPQKLQRGIPKVELQPWVRKIHTDGDKLLPHGTGNTTMRSRLSSGGRHDGQGSVQDTGGGRSNGITEKEDSDGTALTGGGGGDHGQTAFTHSSSLPQRDGGEHLRSLLQREGMSKKEIQVILKAFQEERRRNHSRYGDLARLSTQPASQASPGDDAVRTEIAPSSRKPISEPPVRVHTPALPPGRTGEKVAPPMGGTEEDPAQENTPALPVLHAGEKLAKETPLMEGGGGTEADDETEEIDNALRPTKEELELEKETFVDDSDRGPPKTAGDGREGNGGLSKLLDQGPEMRGKGDAGEREGNGGLSKLLDQGPEMRGKGDAGEREGNGGLSKLLDQGPEMRGKGDAGEREGNGGLSKFLDQGPEMRGKGDAGEREGNGGLSKLLDQGPEMRGKGDAGDEFEQDHEYPVDDQHPAGKLLPAIGQRPVGENPPPVKPSQISPKNTAGQVLKNPEPPSYGAWHFFTIFLVVAGSAVMCYVCVHNRKRLREGVSSYTSDKKRRRRVRDYQPLSTTGKM